ncbi:MAG: UDP-N-acetylmuramoylalanine--D-glutamate ligase [Planctomycetes bacterium]|nr:UDP-N-acetylmuramoylalanine--D-glutamate ligase [Planctomycetota bacterium]
MTGPATPQSRGSDRGDGGRPATATVMGLGLFGGGVGVAKHLASLGSRVTVTDLKNEADLAPSIEALRAAGVEPRYVLGRHDEADFTGTDLLIVNPAVPPGNPFVEAARRAGVRIDTEIGLFVRACPARTIGITGSAGKSTTSALTAACLSIHAERRGAGRVLFGGNIGRSLLEDLPSIAAGDTVVLELSSFQLHWLRQEGLRPGIGAITNIRPNHLDWHGTIDAYAADKAGIVPAAGGTLVALHADPVVRGIAERAPCRVVWTGAEGDGGGESGGRGEPRGDAVFWRGDTLLSRTDGAETPVLARSDVRILGGHAAWNVATAAAVCLAAGASPDAIRDGVRGFAGLAHRLCPIGTVRGVLCVDDSKATTPDAAAGALRAFDRPVLLLAGGYDKHLDPGPMVDAASGRARVVVCYGATGPSLAERFEAAGIPDVLRAATLVEAVDLAMAHAAEGDVLLLSPGHASWDQFTNYEARARAFADAVAAYR